MTFEWEDRYSVGDVTLDNQHRQLLHMCAEAQSCLHDDSREGRERFHGLLNDMSLFAATHFRTEEEMLSRKGYPHLAEQQQEHAQYSDTLTEFLFAAVEGKLDRSGVHAYLSEWWLHHILESDMRYKEFLA